MSYLEDVRIISRSAREQKECVFYHINAAQRAVDEEARNGGTWVLVVPEKFYHEVAGHFKELGFKVEKQDYGIVKIDWSESTGRSVDTDI